MDWSAHYPDCKDPVVEILDVGCGFGGLTVSLSTICPQELTLGLEIRPKVCEFVRLKIQALRQKHPGQVCDLLTALMALVQQHISATHKCNAISASLFQTRPGTVDVDFGMTCAAEKDVLLLSRSSF